MNNLSIHKNIEDTKKSKIHIVLSGGGTKGFFALSIFEQLLQYHSHIDTISSSSVGCLVSIFFLLGFSKEETLDYCQNKNWSFLFDLNISNLIVNNGLINTDTVKNLLSELLRIKGLSEKCTLIDLYNITNIKWFISSYCVSTHKNVFFNVMNDPYMKIIDVIIMSCSVPIWWPPFIYKGKIYVDSVVVQNIPIDYINLLTPNELNEAIIYKLDYIDNQNITMNQNNNITDGLQIEYWMSLIYGIAAQYRNYSDQKANDKYVCNNINININKLNDIEKYKNINPKVILNLTSDIILDMYNTGFQEIQQQLNLIKHQQHTKILAVDNNKTKFIINKDFITKI